MTRDEYGQTCPLGATGRRSFHVWIETTMPHYDGRRFSCDFCCAIAGEAQRGETVKQGSTGTASTRAAEGGDAQGSAA